MTRHRWHSHYHPYYGPCQACERCGLVGFTKRPDMMTGKLMDMYRPVEGDTAYLPSGGRVPECGGERKA